MGSWGYGPTENDAAQDWLDYRIKLQMYNEIHRVVFDYQDSDECEIVPEEVICAINLFASLQSPSVAGICFKTNINELAKTNGFVDKAVSVLDQILQNRGWIDDWNNDELITPQITKLITALRSIK